MKEAQKVRIDRDNEGEGIGISRRIEKMKSSENEIPFFVL